MAGITIQPYATNQPTDSFLLETQGYVQGMPLDDTASRLWLMGGNLASSASTPLWGGVPIEELINVTGTGADGLGPTVQASTSQATCTGFSTFAQMMHGVITPGATVPLYGPLNGVGFFRLGTNARLAVNCDPALAAALASADGAINSQALYWSVADYWITLTTTSNWALPTSIRLLSVNTNSKVVTYNSGTGAATWGAGVAAILNL